MSKIALSGNASGTGTFTFASPNSNTDRTLSLPDQTATLITNSSDVLNIGSGQLYKDASGNLGIGTSSPSAKLHLSGTTGATSSTYLENTGSAIGSVIGGTYFYSRASANNWFSGVDAYVPSGSAGVDFTDLRFYTKSTERARIDSSGSLLVGQTNTGLQNANSWDFNRNGQAYGNHASGTGSGTAYWIFGLNTVQIGSITQSGTTAVSYNTTSDYRLKENVQPLAGALSRIAALKPCTYTWKSAPDEIGEGFIAHELAEVCPQAVTGEKDAVNEDGSIKPQSIDTSFLVATLTAAIQELKAIVDAQGAEIAALKGQA